jgi:molybdopterin converting factor subunit 1
VQITVRFFAAHREATGRPMLALDLPEGTSAQGAFNELCSRFPGLGQAASSVAFAVNQALTSGEQVLQAGDELALLPPVAGG